MQNFNKSKIIAINKGKRYLSMKKKRKSKNILNYNENTKIISMIADNQNKNKFKIFCEQNRIYFETILMLVLTVVGIIVSIASVKVGIIANNMAAGENHISDLEKQPTFVMKKEINKTEEKYIIKNTGGTIRFGNLFLDKIIEIVIYDENYEYLGKGYIVLDNYIEDNYSEYDFQSESFTITTKLVSKPILKYMEIIEDIITNKGYFYGIRCTEHLDLEYENYKQELVQRDIIMDDNRIIDNFSSDQEYDFEIYINVDDLDKKQLKTDIENEINLLLSYRKVSF